MFDCELFTSYYAVKIFAQSLDPPMMSFRFLFRLNGSIGFSLNIFASLLFVNSVA